MAQDVVGNILSGHAQGLYSPAKTDGVPENDRGDDEIGSGGAMLLVFLGPVADFAEAVEEDSSGKVVPDLSLVQTGLHPVAQVGLEHLFECENRAFDAPDLTEDVVEAAASALVIGHAT